MNILKKSLIITALCFKSFGAYSSSSPIIQESDRQKFEEFQKLFQGDNLHDQKLFSQKYKQWLRKISTQRVVMNISTNVAYALFTAGAFRLCQTMIPPQISSSTGSPLGVNISDLTSLIGTGGVMIDMGRNLWPSIVDFMRNEENIWYESMTSGKIKPWVDPISFFYQPQRPSSRFLAQEYAIYKKYFSHSLIERIETSLFSSAMYSNRQNDGWNNQQANNNPQDWANSINFIVKFPKESRKISFDEEKFNDLFQFYADETKQEFKRICSFHESSYTPEEGQNKFSKKVIFLFGPPGSGKSLAASLIAQATGASLSAIYLPGSKDNKFEEKLFGDNEFPIKDAGILAKAFYSPIVSDQTKKDDLAQPCRNPIILIDEIDKGTSINNKLLPLFDPDTKSIRAGVIDNLDISHAMFILTSNTSPEELKKKDNEGVFWEAVLDRCYTVHLDSPNPQNRSSILWSYTINNYIKAQQDRGMTLELNEEQKKKLNQIILNSKDMTLRQVMIKVEFELEFLLHDCIKKEAGVVPTSDFVLEKIS